MTSSIVAGIVIGVVIGTVLLMLVCIQDKNILIKSLKIHRDQLLNQEASLNTSFHIYMTLYHDLRLSSDKIVCAANELVKKIVDTMEAEDFNNGNETSRRYEYHEFRDLIDALNEYPDSPDDDDEDDDDDLDYDEEDGTGCLVPVAGKIGCCDQ